LTLQCNIATCSTNLGAILLESNGRVEASCAIYDVVCRHVMIGLIFQ
jgi:hypothetical protein